MAQTSTFRPRTRGKATTSYQLPAGSNHGILEASATHHEDLDLSIIDWQTIIDSTSVSTYPSHAELFHQGNRVEHVFLLERGMIKVTHTDDKGSERIITLVSTPGYILGAPCAVLETHFVTYTTLTPSKLRPIPAELFREVLQTDVGMSWQLHKVHCRIIYDQVNSTVRQGGQSVRQRMEEFIWQIASAMGTKVPPKNVQVKLPLKYSEIAQLFMVSPEHLCRVVKKMVNERVIQREKGMIIVPNPHKLWRGQP